MGLVSAVCCRYLGPASPPRLSVETAPPPSLRLRSPAIFDSNLPQFEIFLKYGREKYQTARKLYWIQLGENKAIGGSGRTELDRVEAPRGEEIPRPRLVRRRIPLAMPLASFCRAIPP